MGEVISMWPTAGGQYHWVHMLAPEGWKEILSYLTGCYDRCYDVKQVS